MPNFWGISGLNALMDGFVGNAVGRFSNMNILNWVKTGMYVSLIVLFGFCSYFMWTATQAVKQASVVVTQAGQSISRTEVVVNGAVNGLKPVEANLVAVTNSLNKTVLAVNSPCGGGHPCGLLADTAKTLNTVRGTFGQIEIAANHENRNLSNLDIQEAQLFSQTSGVLSGLSETEVSANKAVTDFDVLLSSPDLSGILKNANTVTYNLGQTSTDFQNKFHAVLFPPPCIGKFCFIKKAWPYIKTASELAEPAYWGSQLIQSIH